MHRQEFKGKLRNLKGRAKAAAGALIGNKRKEAQGQAERAKAAVQQKAGEKKRKLNESSEESGEERGRSEQESSTWPPTDPRLH